MKKTKQAYEYEARLIVENITAYLKIPLDIFRVEGVVSMSKQLLKIAKEYNKDMDTGVK